MVHDRSEIVSKSQRRKFLSQVELQTLLSYVKSQADLARERGTIRAIVDELIVLLLVRAGLRANEIRALRIADLPTGHGERTLWIRNETGEVLRKVDITSDVAQLLSRFVRLYRKGAQIKDSLLETERGSPFGYMSLYNKVHRIGKKVGIGKLTPSLLQHTYMVRLYEVEHDLRYVQEQTGYVSRRTLAKYLLKGRSKRTSLIGSSAELTGQEHAEQQNRHKEQRCACEACGIICELGHGRRIESGQFLCHRCLEYFRTGRM